MLAALPDCLFHKITQHTNQHAALVRLGQSNHDMRARMRSMIPELSALRLQRFWRWCRLFASTKCLAARFRLTRLSFSSATAMAFIPLTLHLRLKWVVRTCERYFNRIQTISTLVQPTAPHLTAPNILSAYLTGCQPHGVFGDMGVCDIVLNQISAAVIKCIDAITDHISEIDYSSLHQSVKIFIAYWHTLHVWNDPSLHREDEKLYRMTHALQRYLPLITV